MSNFTMTHETSEKHITIDLEGTLNEDAIIESIDINNPTKVIVNFELVSSINSCGIREWISFLKTFPETTVFEYKNCPPAVIDQVNTISGFLPENGTVLSFYISYYCDSCENTDYLKGDGKKSRKEMDVPDFCKCSKCGEKAELDVVESKYFKFLK